MRGCRNTKSEIEKFIAARTVKKNGCLVWSGDTTKSGYARIHIGGAAFAVRRIAWWLEHGYLPQGVHMKAVCNNKLCFTPDHARDSTPESERRPTLFRPGKEFNTQSVNTPFLDLGTIAMLWESVLMGERTIYRAAKQFGVSWHTLKKHLKRYESKL